VGGEPRGYMMTLKIEMTLTAETAKRLQETGERLAFMNLGDDGMLAAVILTRIARNYDRALHAQKVETIPLESLNAEIDE
jgi:hypothetical protein